MKSSFNPMNRERRVTPQVQKYFFLQKITLKIKAMTLEPFTIGIINVKKQVFSILKYVLGDLSILKILDL